MSPAPVINALCIVTSESSRMIGPLHALHYYWPELTSRQRSAALAEARESAEEILQAIKDAQASIAANDQVPA